LDLLGRKIMLQKLKPIGEHCSQLRSLCMQHLFSGGSLGSHARSLMYHTLEWQYLTYRIAAKASSDKEWISSASVDYMMYSGYVTLAAHWLKMEATAVKKLSDGGTEEAGFYNAKVSTSAFVFDKLLPRTRTHKAVMMSPVESVMSLHADDFSFDHTRP